jgi:hypothetical protein
MISERRQRRPWRQSIDGQFAPRRIEMLESPAYRVLSLSARRVIDRVEIELAHHGGNDNGRLPVTFANFEHYGIHNHGIAPGIREAEALGFLEITERGRAGNREFRSPNKYRLTFRHVDRAKPTDEWRRIQTIEEAESIARVARKPTKPRPVKKQNSTVGKRSVSLLKTNSENTNRPLLESNSTAKVLNPTVLSISRVPGLGPRAKRASSFPPKKSPAGRG